MMIEEKKPSPPADEQDREPEDDGVGQGSPGDQRLEPVVTDLDQEGYYGEPERGSDWPTKYPGEDLEDAPAESEHLSRDAAAETDASAEVWHWEEPDPDAHWRVDQHGAEAGDTNRNGEEENEEHWDEPEPWERTHSWAAGREVAENGGEWQAPEGYVEERQEGSPVLPLGLIAVAVLAVLLLAGGGYGVMQQRAATQAQIQQLQAELAAAVSPREVAAGRDAVRELERRSAELQASVDRLTVENLGLRDTVADLQAELEARQNSAPPSTATSGDSGGGAGTARKAVPAAPAPATSTASSGWFVNFGSYSQRQTAQSWVTRLQPAAGSVTVTSANKAGETFYRVRVVGLSSREQAEGVARRLEREYSLPKLWVGTQ
jgi:cell division septation protein DedD